MDTLNEWKLTFTIATENFYYYELIKKLLTEKNIKFSTKLRL